MNKAAIQRFAIWARTEMIAQVSQRAYQYGITAEGYGEENAVTVNGRVLSSDEQSQRRGLVAQIRQKGFSQVMEEVAYTWFNRFIALRFMEVNNYLPSHVRVFTDANGAFKPEILTEALHLEMPSLDREKVAGFIEKNQTDGLYRYLLLTQCNALNESLPRMFERMGSYTELLLPNNILRPDGIIGRMIGDIPESSWDINSLDEKGNPQGQVEIIGWLYQYYNAELKDETFALLKKNVKITKERIPSATQLFTPDWIVRYMVENSLGRLWIEGHPDAELRTSWRYYLDEAEQEPEVKTQLAAIRTEYSKLRPQNIKVIDPCLGSGHILVYAFDVLVQIYKQTGVSERDAAQSILQNNLYGLDIDDRAAQLAYFAVMMKARQYDRRILTRGIQPHLYSTACFDEGKEYGSLLITDDPGEVPETGQITLDDDERCVRHILAQKYDVVVTNPPYMAVSNASPAMQKYVKDNYPDSKADLFAVFIEQCGRLAKHNGYQAMITQHSWMFLSSFERLRLKLQAVDTVNMAHLGARAFEEIGGEVVQTTTFVLRRSHVKDYAGTYCRLVEPSTQQGKEDMFLVGENQYTAKQANFSKIPGSPVAYWVSNKVYNTYSYAPVGNTIIPRHGLATSDNNRFLKLWYEIDINKGSLKKRCDYSKKWFPMNKGGSYRKWYGNLEWVINYENDGLEIKDYATQLYKSSSRTIQNTQFYFLESITWSALTSGSLSFRWSESGAIFGSGAHCAFAPDSDTLFYGLALLNGKVSSTYFSIVSPTLNTNVDDIRATPYIEGRKSLVVKNVKECISISKSDWDSFETSWDFELHPLVRLAKKSTIKTNGIPAYRIEDAFWWWENECATRFQTLKANEEELNRIFIYIYGLQDELTPEVEDKDVTVRLADLGRDVRSLISYAVGCMFGRYSLDKPGLVFAGGDWDSAYRVEKGHLVDEHGRAITFGGLKLSVARPPQINIDGAWKNTSFAPDADNIIPICDDEYFDDDIVGRFVQWVEVVYGEATLEVNLKFIADALGGKGTPREVIRSYFLNDFYADHLKIYQKRPIYWLFDSGKKNGFKALIYMHRYQSDLLARMRTDYVHEQQERYRTQLRHIEDAMADASTSERVKLSKQQAKLQEQALELQKYEEKIHHLADQNLRIDLDDGVKHNYSLFADVLAKIK